MSVRARFYVSQVARNAGDTSTIKLSAVSRGKENSEWSKFTPGGSVELSLTRLASPAFDWFNDRVGKEVFIDFNDADNPVCTQCGEPIKGGQMGVSTPGEEYGQGIHAGNEMGYIPGEFVHNSCMEAAKKRLGIE